MLIPILVFVIGFAVIATILYTGVQLFQNPEDPLADRLDVLQANSPVTTNATRTPRRRGGGGAMNTLLYVISLVPGGEDWLTDTEKELAQAGIRNKRALANYALFQILFFLVILGGMLYFQRDNPLVNKMGGLAAAFILGYLL